MENQDESSVLESSPTSMTLSVQVGAINDPDDCKGLSHLLEHLLLNGGSKKYPDFQLNNDFMDKDLCNISSGESNYTLLESGGGFGYVQKKLMEHFKKYYIANLMKLCIISTEPVDNLEKLSIKYFSLLKSGENPHAKSILSQSLPILNGPISVKSSLTKLDNRLVIDWLIPNLSYKKDSSDKILSHLLGHLSKGSISAALIKKKLAFHVLSTVTRYTDDINLISLRIELLGNGVNNIDTIISIIYQYIEKCLSDQQSIPDYIFNEMQQIGKQNWSQYSPMDPKETMTSWNYYKDPSEVFSNMFLISNVNRDNLAHLVSFLNPKNMMITLLLTTDNFKVQLCDPNYKKETIKYYKLDYYLKINPSKWNMYENKECEKDLFHLPIANPFISNEPPKFKNLQLQQGVNNTDVIFNKNGVKIYHCPDRTFNSLYTCVNIEIVSNQDIHSIEEEIMFEILKMVYTTELKHDLLYYLQLASIHFSFDPTHSRHIVMCEGINDRVIYGVEYFFNYIQNIKTLNQSKFEIAKELVKKKYNFYLMLPPSQYTQFQATFYLHQHQSDPIRLLPLIESLSLKSFLQYVKDFFNATFTIFAGGNITLDECIGLGDYLISRKSIETPKDTRIDINQPLIVPNGIECRIKSNCNIPNNQNTCILALVQDPSFFSPTMDQVLESNAMSFVIAPLIDAKLSQEFKKTGFTVHCEFDISLGGFKFLIESDSMEEPHTVLELLKTRFFPSVAHELFRDSQGNVNEKLFADRILESDIIQIEISIHLA
eukprot:gene4242-5311_t